MIILGIDPGTACGWGIIDGKRRIASGTWNLRGSRFEGGGMRFLRLRRYMSQVIRDGEVKAVGFEEVRRHAATDAAHIYGGIIAVIMSYCEEHDIPFTAVPVGTIKKVATGKGNAGKEAMISAAKEAWDYLPETDDEADALWIAETLRRELGAE